MTDHDTLTPSPDARLAERRRFLQLAGGASVAAGGLALLSACGSDNDDDPDPSPSPSPSPTPTPTSTSTSNADRGTVNFALQMEYLQAQYFAYATTGAGVSADLLTGTGAPGAVTGGAAVSFSDAFLAACSREIAAEAQRRIAYLRGIVTVEAVAQPAIDISATPFSAALGETFNPYAGQGNFLLGAFFLQDVIVTAYKGLQPFINIGTTRTGFFGLLGAQSYHAGLIRTALYADADLRARATRFSDARDALDGTSDQDQGVVVNGAANISPADANGVTFSRATTTALNVLYVNKASVSAGGFFPAGLNGDLKTSAAN